MKKLYLILLFALFNSQPALSAGFHETSFDLITGGTVFFGASPLYSASTYTNSVYTGFGYQATAGFDHSFNETFGVRGTAGYAHLAGSNTANTKTAYENISVNDLELGAMATFNGYALGGGVISRSSTVDYTYSASTISSSYSGFLKFAKASLDFTSKSGQVGFSLSESYIFGTLSSYNVTEWRSLFHVFFLLNLK